MIRLWKLLGAAAALAGATSAHAAESDAARPPWESSSFSLETGLLWQAGRLTPLSYRLVPTQFSWRGAAGIKRVLGARMLVVRPRLTLFGTWVQQGPESHYIALAASPSIELWAPSRRWCVFGGAGGGLGVIDSRGVPGGQGQDLTLNWFARSGLEYRLRRGPSLIGAVMFQHLSNGGRTTPNPGIDAVGFNLGASWSF